MFQERIKQLRKEQKLTQTQAANEIGMAMRNYQKLEKEGAKPNYDNLLSIADVFDVSVDWLMGRTDDPKLHQLSTDN